MAEVKQGQGAVAAEPVVGGIAHGTAEAVKFVGEAFANAAKMELATQVSKGMLVAAKKALGDKWPEALNNPLLEKLLMLAIPLALRIAAESSPEMPYRKQVLAATSFAITGVSKETVEELAQAAMPFITDVAMLGAAVLAQKLEAPSIQELPVGEEVSAA